MTDEQTNHGPNLDNLAHWIELSGESDFVDAKSAMIWDGADASASLAKDIASFANSRDGGVIVIGKAERDDGAYEYAGVSADQATSFDTTTVAQWVNARFSPPIRLACYQAEIKGRTFVVIVVQEFDDIPILCIKSYQQSTNPKNHLLREGTIYIRNQNAESKPITTVDELRNLIGLATRKRGDELLSHFEAMLKGRSPISLPSTPDPFVEEVQQVQRDLKCDLSNGGWWMAFHPQHHSGVRWTSPETLERLISHHAVRIIDEFPGHTKGTFSMGWGIANDLYGETWALTKSGLFCFWKEFRENGETAEHTGYRGGSEARLPIPPGEWIEYTWTIRTMVEFFLFLSRFVAVYEPGEKIAIRITVGPLAGRKLVALSHDITIGFGTPEPCRAPLLDLEKSIDAEELRASWESICADALKQLVELFPNHRIEVETLLKWVERFKTRGF
jgi:schlafen family protein